MMNKTKRLGIGLALVIASCTPAIQTGPLQNPSLDAQTNPAEQTTETSDLLAQSLFLFVGSLDNTKTGIFLINGSGEVVSALPTDLVGINSWASLPTKGSIVAFGSPNGDIYLGDLTVGEIQPLVVSPSLDEKPIWSPGGERFAFERNSFESICLADSNGLVTVLLPAQENRAYWLGNWDREGTELVYTEFIIPQGPEGVQITPASRLRIIDVETGISTDIQFDEDLGFDGPRNPMFSPNGDMIAFQAVSADGNVRIFVTSRDGSSVRELTTLPGDYTNALWSPDGRYILVNGVGPSTYSIFAVKGELVFNLNGLNGVITQWVSIH